MVELDFKDDPVLDKAVKDAVGVIDRAIALYGIEGLAFSFNGGKDSVVVLHLLRAAIHQRGLTMGDLYTFYFVRKDEFEEIETFVRDADTSFELKMRYLDGDFKSDIDTLVKTTPVRGILLGTRVGDPNADDQQLFCPSSPGWPPFMRINPILNWSYELVWKFLRVGKFPYCHLYDLGYTSIGSVKDTKPNPSLQRPDGSFAPAYELRDASLERSGRTLPAWMTKKAAPEAPKPPAPSAQAQRALGKSGLLHSESYGNVGSLNVGSDEGAPKAALPGPPPSPVGAGSLKTCALVMVGDEILSGRVQDENTGYLLKEFRSMGWRVVQVAIVPDDADSIAAQIRSLLPKVDLIVTCGGVGPTLDDVTMQGVAKALGSGSMVQHPELVRRLTSIWLEKTTEHHLKMSEVPENETVELIDVNKIEDILSFNMRRRSGEASSSSSSFEPIEAQLTRLESLSLQRGEGPLKDPFPLIVVAGRVALLPGVPALMRKKFCVLSRTLTASSPFQWASVRLNTDDETRIAQSLKDVLAELGGAKAGKVSLGSYPLDAEQADGAGVELQIEGKDGALVKETLELLRTKIPRELWLGEKSNF